MADLSTLDSRKRLHHTTDLPDRYRAQVLAEFPDQVERILLFGSRARGEANDRSDWDFAVFLDHEPTADDRSRLNAIDWKIGGPCEALIQSHVLTGQKWRATDEFACNIRDEGVIIHGPVEVPTIMRPVLDHAHAAFAKVQRYADQAAQASAYETIIRSSYYAMFYAARAALLAVDGSASTNHGRVIQAFTHMAARRCDGQSREHAAALKGARELWIRADYGYDDLTEAGHQLREQVALFLEFCRKIVDHHIDNG